MLKLPSSYIQKNALFCSSQSCLKTSDSFYNIKLSLFVCWAGASSEVSQIELLGLTGSVRYSHCLSAINDNVTRISLGHHGNQCTTHSLKGKSLKIKICILSLLTTYAFISQMFCLNFHEYRPNICC